MVFLGLFTLGITLYGLYHTFHPVILDPIHGYCRKGWRLKPNQSCPGTLRFSIPLTEIRGLQVLIKRRDPRGYRFGSEINLVLSDNQRKNLLICPNAQLAFRIVQRLVLFLNKPILASPDLQGYASPLQENQILTTPIQDFYTNIRSRKLKETLQGVLEFVVLPGSRLFYQVPALFGVILLGSLYFLPTPNEQSAVLALLRPLMAIFALFFAWIIKRKIARPIFFDLFTGYCEKAAPHKIPPSDPFADEFRIPLQEVAGFQLLEDLTHRNQGRAYHSGELNLILKNGIRAHLFTSGNLQALYEDVRQLSQRTKIPILASPSFLPIQQKPVLQPSEPSELPAFYPTPLTASQRKRHRLISIACTCPLWLGGILFAALATVDLYHSSQSVNWPTTEGTILRTDANKKRKSNQYEASIRYRYEVDRKEFTSTRIGMSSPSFPTRKEALEWLSQYPVGNVVTVYHNSHKPSLAVLQPGFQPKLIWLIFIGLLFIIIPIYMATTNVQQAEKRHLDKQRREWAANHTDP